MRISLSVEILMKNNAPKKPSDADQYNNYVVTEIEKGNDPETFLDWYIDKYHGHIIDATKKKDKKDK